MKPWLLSIFCSIICLSAEAQVFMGLQGIENTVSQIKENPAYTVTGDLAQISFGNIGCSVGGNSVLFKRSIVGFLDSGRATMDVNYSRNYDRQPKSFYGNIEINGPACAFLLFKKYFVSASTGLRYLANSDNLDYKTYRMLGVNPYMSPNVSDTFTINNYALTAQLVNEWNLSYGGYIIDNEDKKLVAGATLKILNGMAAFGFGIDNAQYNTQNNDGIAYHTTGNARIAFTPNAHIWAMNNAPLRGITRPTNNLSLGGDVGLIYYLRPNESMQIKSGYVARFAVSVTDIGFVNYTASTTSGNYSVNNKNINYRNIQNNTDLSFGTRIFNEYVVDTLVQPTEGISKFKVWLPMALRCNADFKIDDHFFVNANAIVNLRKPDAAVFSNHYITTVTITPRYKYHQYAFSLPFSFTPNGQGYIGAVFFAGPVYIGSNSVLQMATSNSMSTLNLFLGGQMRIAHRNPRLRALMAL